jgi:hypothetical protein
LEQGNPEPLLAASRRRDCFFKSVADRSICIVSALALANFQEPAFLHRAPVELRAPKSFADAIAQNGTYEKEKARRGRAL